MQSRPGRCFSIAVFGTREGKWGNLIGDSEEVFVPRGELPREIPGCRWSSLISRCLPLILLRFPAEGSKLLHDSIQKSCPGPAAGGEAGHSSPGCATPGGCLGFLKEPSPLLMSPRWPSLGGPHPAATPAGDAHQSSP